MRRVLIIGNVWPEPASSAAGTRILQLAQFFIENGSEVFFGSAAQPTSFSTDLSQPGLRPFPVQLNDMAFDGNLRELDPSAVVFDRFTTEEKFGWKVADNCPAALRILDTEDLHGLRAARLAALAENRPLAISDLHNDIAKREIAAIYRCDLSLIISKAEMQLLQNVFSVDAALCFYLPFLFEPLTEKNRSEWLSFSQRRDMVSIGNFLHAPNRDAARYLRHVIWPLIHQQLPAAKMLLYGAYHSKADEALHAPALNFLMLGRAKNSAEVMRQARLCLAPLRAGAGLKGKLAEAMSCGTPSVTTATGAEGMGDTLNWPGCIADEPEAFAEAAVRLYTSEKAWANAAGACAPRFNALFRKKEHEAAFAAKLSSLTKELETHRLSNFTGAVLMYQKHHASRWLGRFIELKNTDQITDNEKGLEQKTDR